MTYRLYKLGFGTVSSIRVYYYISGLLSQKNCFELWLYALLAELPSVDTGVLISYHTFHGCLNITISDRDKKRNQSTTVHWTFWGSIKCLERSAHGRCYQWRNIKLVVIQIDDWLSLNWTIVKPYKRKARWYIKGNVTRNFKKISPRIRLTEFSPCLR